MVNSLTNTHTTKDGAAMMQNIQDVADGMSKEELREILMGTPAQESRKDFDEYDDDEDADVLSIEDIKDMLSDEDGFDVEIRSPKKGVQVIYVLSEDPGMTRHLLKAEVLPDLGLDFIQPRKTKSTGFMLDIVQDGSDEVVPVRIVKGGQHQRGRKNELGFQNFVKN